MAVYNEILAGRINRLFQKLLSMKGPASVNTLAAEVMPTLEIDLTPAEFFLQEWQSFGQATSQSGVAGIASAVRFRNPLTSGVIILFESVIFSPSVNDTLFVDYGTTSLDLNTVVATGNQLDSRQKLGNGQIGSLVISRTNTVAATGLQAMDEVQLLASTSWQLIPHTGSRIPLLPGDAVQIRNNTVNVGLTTGARWRQRPLEDSEKN